MTKEKAIQILDQAVAMINTNRQAHQLLMEALAYLSKNTEEKPKK